MMLAVFYLWQGVRDILGLPVNPLAMLVGIAWMMTAVFLLMDLIRHRNPLYNAWFINSSAFRPILRKHEHQGFNASTYYLLGASLLMTGVWLKLIKEPVLVMAILVLGLADPAAALARYCLSRWGVNSSRGLGLLVFAAVSYLVMSRTVEFLGSRLDAGSIYIIGATVALTETYAKHWVSWLSPLTLRLRRCFAGPVADSLERFYPDDNLLVPLVIGLMAFILDR